MENDIADSSCTTDSDDISRLEGKTPSELDAKIEDYQRKVKQSWMQAMQRRQDEEADYIGIKAAEAQTVSAHIECAYRVPPYMFSSPRDSLRGRATSFPEGVATEQVHKALGLAPPPSGTPLRLTSTAWRNALAELATAAQLTLMQATAAPPPAKVSPPNKLHDIDPRLSISSSKVQRPSCMMWHLTLLWSSLRAHLGVGTTQP